MTERDRVSGVGVLDRAMSILSALEISPLGLAELVEATGLPRATAHRLATALEAHDLVGRDGSGRFVLGTRMAKRSRELATVAVPALVRLRDATDESVQLYVPRNGARVCVASLESPHSLRTIVPVGATLPLELGSAGRVLSGQEGRPWIQTVEERERGVTSVSAPVRDPDGVLVAAVSVSGPVERTTRQPGEQYGDAVVAAAEAIEAVLRELPADR
jgi:DNA-binding IclR family transcriptional regulator